MKRQFLFLVLAAALLVLGTPAKAHAWGAFHVGYTHVGLFGVQHYGATVGVDRFGYRGAYGGLYRDDYGGLYGGYRRYYPDYTGGYVVGGYHYGSVYTPGVYRYY
jgi:hypothetical protein